MIQAYTGRIESGRFLPIDGTEVPDCKVAVLVVEGSRHDKSLRQAEAMLRFREEIRRNDESVPEFEPVRFRETEI